MRNHLLNLAVFAAFAVTACGPGSTPLEPETTGAQASALASPCASCAATEYCDFAVDPPQCAARVTGSACTDHNQCPAAQYCGATGYCTNRAAGTCAGLPQEKCLSTAYCNGTTCATRLNAGVACTADYQCKSGNCNATTGLCQATCPGVSCDSTEFCNTESSPVQCYEKRPVGGACFADDQCVSGNCDEGVTARCVDPCTTTSCDDHEYCDASGAPICRDRILNGEACSADDQCLGNRCDAKSPRVCVAPCTVIPCDDPSQFCDTSGMYPVCAPRLPRGAACTADADCVSGNCNGTCLDACPGIPCEANEYCDRLEPTPVCKSHYEIAPVSVPPAGWAVLRAPSFARRTTAAATQWKGDYLLTFSPDESAIAAGPSTVVIPIPVNTSFAGPIEGYTSGYCAYPPVYPDPAARGLAAAATTAKITCTFPAIAPNTLGRIGFKLVGTGAAGTAVKFGNGVSAPAISFTNMGIPAANIGYTVPQTNILADYVDIKVSADIESNDRAYAAASGGDDGAWHPRITVTWTNVGRSAAQYLALKLEDLGLEKVGTPKAGIQTVSWACRTFGVQPTMGSFTPPPNNSFDADLGIVQNLPAGSSIQCIGTGTTLPLSSSAGGTAPIPTGIRASVVSALTTASVPWADDTRPFAERKIFVATGLTQPMGGLPANGAQPQWMEAFLYDEGTQKRFSNIPGGVGALWTEEGFLDTPARPQTTWLVNGRFRPNYQPAPGFDLFGRCADSVTARCFNTSVPPLEKNTTFMAATRVHWPAYPCEGDVYPCCVGPGCAPAYGDTNYTQMHGQFAPIDNVWPRGHVQTITMHHAMLRDRLENCPQCGDAKLTPQDGAPIFLENINESPWAAAEVLQDVPHTIEVTPKMFKTTAATGAIIMYPVGVYYGDTINRDPNIWPYPEPRKLHPLVPSKKLPVTRGDAAVWTHTITEMPLPDKIWLLWDEVKSVEIICDDGTCECYPDAADPSVHSPCGCTTAAIEAKTCNPARDWYYNSKVVFTPANNARGEFDLNGASAWVADKLEQQSTFDELDPANAPDGIPELRFRAMGGSIAMTQIRFANDGWGRFLPPYWPAPRVVIDRVPEIVVTDGMTVPVTLLDGETTLTLKIVSDSCYVPGAVIVGGARYLPTRIAGTSDWSVEIPVPPEGQPLLATIEHFHQIPFTVTCGTGGSCVCPVDEGGKTDCSSLFRITQYEHGDLLFVPDAGYRLGSLEINGASVAAGVGSHRLNAADYAYLWTDNSFAACTSPTASIPVEISFTPDDPLRVKVVSSLPGVSFTSGTTFGGTEYAGHPLPAPVGTSYNTAAVGAAHRIACGGYAPAHRLSQVVVNGVAVGGPTIVDLDRCRFDFLPVLQRRGVENVVELVFVDASTASDTVTVTAKVAVGQDFLGLVSPAARTYTKGDPASFVVMPASGHEIDGVVVSVGGVAAVDATADCRIDATLHTGVCDTGRLANVTQDLVYTVSFKPLAGKVTVTARADASSVFYGIVSPDSKEYTRGQGGSFTAIPVPGYEIARILVSVAGAASVDVTASDCTIDPTSDVAVCNKGTLLDLTENLAYTVVFSDMAAPKLRIQAVVVNGGGSLLCHEVTAGAASAQAMTVVSAGESVICVATPDGDYELTSLVDVFYGSPDEMIGSVIDLEYVLNEIVTDHLLKATFKLVLGKECGSAQKCASGFCIDGRCCEGLCDKQCEACGTSGRCEPIAAHLTPAAPKEACGGEGACGGYCDGVHRSCVFPGTQVACDDPSCDPVSGVAVLSSYCNGTGFCAAPNPYHCALGCDGTTCASSACARHEDCGDGLWCNAGSCVPVKPSGNYECTADAECADGNCVDGYCCSSSCADAEGMLFACAACNLAGREGICSPSSSPLPGRAQCRSDGSSCGGQCDGKQYECSYPSATDLCDSESTARCQDDLLVAPAHCDGAGACGEAEMVSCAPFRCELHRDKGAECGEVCASSEDCAEGFLCDGHACIPVDEVVGVQGTPGCGTAAGVPSAWLLGLIALGLLGLRRRGVAGGSALAAATLAFLVAPSTGSAQSFDRDFMLQRFGPDLQSRDVLGVGSAQTPGHLDLSMGLYLNYAREPLRRVTSSSEELIVSDQTSADMGFSLTLLDRFEISAVLPITLRLAGSDLGGLIPPAEGDFDSAAVAGLRLAPKVRIGSAGDFHLAFAMPLYLPFTSTDYISGGSFINPKLIGEYASDYFRLLANVGYMSRGESQFIDLEVGSAVGFGVGAEVPFRVFGEDFAGLATLAGERGLANDDKGALPLELLAGLKWTTSRGLDVTLAGGPGLTTGYGSPELRVVAGVGYAFGSPQKSNTPECVRLCAPAAEPAPEPSPLTDNRQEIVLQQGSTAAVSVLTEDWGAPADEVTVSKFESGAHGKVSAREDGRLEYRPDAGFTGSDVFVYTVRSADGRSARGIVDVTVTPLPTPAEPARARVEGEKIIITEPVYFATAKDVILDTSHPVLDAVVAVMRDNSQITRLRIEGHTDLDGSFASNMDLSDRRARSVMRYLVENGLDQSRLTAAGFGPTRPVATNATKAGKAANRRVEFLIVERDPS